MKLNEIIDYICLNSGQQVSSKNLVSSAIFQFVTQQMAIPYSIRITEIELRISRKKNFSSKLSRFPRVLDQYFEEVFFSTVALFG